MKPKSKELWILDIKKMRFVKEIIESKINLPPLFSSVQTENGHIFVVGGINSIYEETNTLYEIDGNMRMI